MKKKNKDIHITSFTNEYWAGRIEQEKEKKDKIVISDNNRYGQVVFVVRSIKKLKSLKVIVDAIIKEERNDTED